MPFSGSHLTRFHAVNQAHNCLAAQPLGEAVQVLDAEGRHCPLRTSGELNFEWFAERVEVAEEDVLQVNAQAGHVGKDLAGRWVALDLCSADSKL